MDEALEAVGIDANHTPVDQLPEHGAWALAEDILLQQGEDPTE